MEVVTREEFEAVDRKIRRKICGAANWDAYRKIVIRRLTSADDASSHAICCEDETPSRGIVTSESSALAFGFALMNASEADDPVVS